MTFTNYTYNAANQLVSDGTNTLTYDNNGNLTSDGVNSYTWDRANRLLTWDNGVAADLVNHAYDGEGRRVSQAVGTTSPTITKYLLDIQPGLAVVLSQTEGSDVTRFVHAPRGIHARQDASSDWHWSVQDGLGTVRVETDSSVGVEGSQNLDPFGNLIDLNGTIGTPYGFTGELVDGSGLLDLRARRYIAGLGTFASLDPFEGMRDRAMSLNGYSWVEGNVPNAIDPTGMCFDPVTGVVCALAALALLLAGCSSTPTPAPIPTPSLSDTYRLTNTDWLGLGLVQFDPTGWGDGNREAALLALDLIARASPNRTPNDIINRIVGRSGKSFILFSPQHGDRVGAGYNGQYGFIQMFAADLPNSFLQPGIVGLVVHEMAHGIDESLGSGGKSFTENGGFNGVGWSQNPDGTWTYSGSREFGNGRGPANSYIANPAEDFANSFAAVVFELNQSAGLISVKGKDLSSIVVFVGDANGDMVVGVDEFGPVDNGRRSIIQSIL